MTFELHIQDRIEQYLTSIGFKFKFADNGDQVFTSWRKFDHLAGNLTNGERLVTIVMDETGRWLERHDGWGKAEKCLDLRNYWSKEASEAIEDLLGENNLF